ncbi:P-loop containing nucleoside triphosphate hydrolase protein [Auriculariales sp. MPI-PUGE-AT-0066]|nr:P-loop containing nucleoside triphosphate hydrolase protein [Auriculariales sp. MPI-PUGE-AT-0066]
MNDAPVKSIKGALYLENIKELGPWRILISSRADRDLRQARNRDRKMFQTYLKKIKELSHGHFSADNQKRLTGSNIAIPIYEAKMTADTRLVYRVDCIPEYGSDVILVIYGIYTHAQLERGAFWNSVGLQISHRGREYRRRCTARSEPVGLKGDSVYAPISFPEMDTTAEETVDLSGLSIPQHDLSELHELLVLEKFVPLSQALLNSMVANIDVTHPFNPSPSEKQIIEHPGSCYVIGRSGTGKTTTLLFRILSRERAFKKDKDNTRKPRQLFITQSRVLAGKVEEFYWKLHDSIDIADYTPDALKKPGGGADIMARHTKRVEDLIYQEDVKNYRSDLPQRFSELRDEHFPLFLTMERLFEILEADAAAVVSTSPTSAKKANSPVQSTVKTGFTACRQLLSYKIWQTEYWPHFAEHLTKGLDPALVYSEIMGVIKGSGESLLHAQRHLDFKAYENFSARRQSTFANQRKRIYDLFEAYQRQKRDKGHLDAADRTHVILSQIQNDTKVIGQPLDYLYVDEAQDNLLIDALLLRAICCNPDGLFWAGDTAQTISVGSSFRFNDLRAFLHRVEEKRVADANKAEAQAPALFQLTVNYRSHGGIVSCAHSLITLITRFWPDSIDNVAAERGVVEGARPVFFTGWSDGNARYDQFLFGSKDERIDFGARQCIIVRNDEAQAKLRAEVGDIGIIFTVMEAKGLEFDDVLIYNFFNDSSVSEQQWRVVLNALVDTPSEQDLAAPEFDAIRHASVCADLKSLYVAVTRARKNMWIVDRSEKGDPMRAVWTASDQVQNCTPDTQAPHIAVRSTEEEWAEQARHLFRHGRFSQARHCFERAQQPHRAAVAHAYDLRRIADERVVSASKKLQDERTQAYLQAANAFEVAITAESYNFNPQERAMYFRIAGECLQKAGKEHFVRAAKCIEKAGEYMAAAKLYREVVYFDDAIRVIETHKLQCEPEAQAIVEAAKLFYFKGREIKKGCRLFKATKDAVGYLEELGLDVAQADVLEYMRHRAAAADVHLQEGRTLSAAEALLKDDTELSEVSALRARDVVLQALSQQVAFERVPRRRTLLYNTSINFWTSCGLEP